jgi:hypothetical protein
MCADSLPPSKTPKHVRFVDTAPDVILLPKKPINASVEYVPDDEFDEPRYFPPLLGDYSRAHRAFWLVINGFASKVSSVRATKQKSLTITPWTPEHDQYATDSESD